MSASVSSSISSSESALNYACSNNNSPKILQKSPSKNIQKYHYPKNIAPPAPTPSNTTMDNNNEQPQIDLNNVLKKDSPQNIQLEKTGSTSADDRKSAVCLLPVKPEADFPHNPTSDPTTPPDPFPPTSFSLEEGSPPSYFEDF